ncbi:MAG: hypothetical protein ACI8PZ_006687 [Myxococcota bacterium]|jgi:hypothetical protein
MAGSLLLWVLVASASPTLDLAGDGCPGPVDLTANGITPGGRAALIASAGVGGDVLPLGGCAGTETRLADPALVTVMRDRDGDGALSLLPTIPEPVCGGYVQLVDLTTCETSGVRIADGADGTCTPDASLPGTGPGPWRTEAAYIDARMEGILHGDALLDFVRDDEVVPAALVFRVLDPRFVDLCEVRFDASELVAVEPGSWDGGFVPLGPIHHAWEVAPDAVGTTDCGEVRSAVFGTSDFRQYLRDLRMGVGLGPLQPELSDLLQSRVADDGGDWEADWEPYLMNTYVAFVGTALDIGYAFTYGHTCGLPDASPAPVPDALEDRFVEASGVYVLAVI